MGKWGGIIIGEMGASSFAATRFRGCGPISLG